MYQSYELHRDNNTALYLVTEEYHQKINGITYTFLDKIMQNNNKKDVCNVEIQKVMKTNYCSEIKMNTANVTACK